MNGYESAVIEAAQDLVMAWEGGKYGPMQPQIKQCEKALVEVMADLQAECEGAWNPENGPDTDALYEMARDRQ